MLPLRLASLQRETAGRVSATNCAHEPGGLSLTRPFGSPSPGGRGKVGAASGRRFMGRPPGRAPATNCAHEPGGLSLTRPFGSPSPGGRGKVGTASGRRFMVKSGRYIVAPVGRGPWTVRVKKATDGLFGQPVRNRLLVGDS